MTSKLRPSLAALAVAAVLAGGGTAAAADWLPAFRTESVAPIGLRTDDLLALPDLGSFGSVEVVEEPDVRTVASADGLDLPRVAPLPRGVAGPPVHQVGDRAVVRFRPAGLPGASVRLEAGPGAAAIWRGEASGAPALLVGRATAPRATATGASFAEVRDHVLSMPGVPAALADQLRRFDPEGSTLPLPVPADEVTTSTASVGDAEATVLVTRDRSAAAVVWVEAGEVTVVAGTLDADELLAVARGLR